jgi:hypothetical protein
VALRPGSLGSAAEFRPEFDEIAGDEGVWAGAGLDPSSDIAAPVDGQFHVDLVTGKVAPGGLQAGEFVGAGDGV